MTRAAIRRLYLMVGNPEVLEYGCRPSHEFGLAGGTIGGRGCSWPLSDRGGRIAQLHTEIVGIDGTFCLVDRSGLTRINDAMEPLGVDRIVRLADGDTMQIGPYRLGVRIGAGDDDVTQALEDRSLDSILASPGPAFETQPWQDAPGGYGTSSPPIAVDDEQVDPLLALDATAVKHSVVDLFDDTHYGLSARHNVLADRADTMVEAFGARSLLTVQTRGALDEPQHDDRPWREQTNWSGTATPTPPHNESLARGDVAGVLRKRLAALSEHDDALLSSVDEALRVILEALANEVARSETQLVAAEGPWNPAQMIETFWKTCERTYRYRVEGRNA